MSRSHHYRASSVPSSPTPRVLTTNTPSKPAGLTPAATAPSRTQHTAAAAAAADNDLATPINASLLQPRVAVVLNVPASWHPWLFALRLASILPAIWWGTPSILRLALRLLELLLDDSGGERYRQSAAGGPLGPSFPPTETALAVIWCFASGYLSFFFTDCLMSRWLINYTPQATVVRLITINTVNAYSTSMLLSVAGGFQDARLLLPGWISIATTLTVCYHLVHQKINIRKETSTSVNVFSIASYLSMLTLLAHLHAHQPSYPTMPVVTGMESAWEHACKIWNQGMEALEQSREL